MKKLLFGSTIASLAFMAMVVSVTEDRGGGYANVLDVGQEMSQNNPYDGDIAMAALTKNFDNYAITAPKFYVTKADTPKYEGTATVLSAMTPAPEGGGLFWASLLSRSIT